MLEPLLRIEPQLLGKAAVMRAHLVLAEPVRQLPGDTLGQPARVDENQRRAMRVGEFHQAVVDLVPDLARHHRFERRGRDLERKIARAMMAGIDDLAIRSFSRAEQEARDSLDRLLGCRQANTQQSTATQGVETLQRHRQMRPALVGRHRVDLVDDHGARGFQQLAAGFGAKQDVERFRGGHDDVRRATMHALAFASRRIAGANPAPDLEVGQALRA